MCFLASATFVGLYSVVNFFRTYLHAYCLKMCLNTTAGNSCPLTTRHDTVGNPLANVLEILATLRQHGYSKGHFAKVSKYRYLIIICQGLLWPLESCYLTKGIGEEL